LRPDANSALSQANALGDAHPEFDYQRVKLSDGTFGIMARENGGGGGQAAAWKAQQARTTPFYAPGQAPAPPRPVYQTPRPVATSYGKSSGYSKSGGGSSGGGGGGGGVSPTQQAINEIAAQQAANPTPPLSPQQQAAVSEWARTHPYTGPYAPKNMPPVPQTPAPVAQYPVQDAQGMIQRAIQAAKQIAQQQAGNSNAGNGTSIVPGVGVSGEPLGTPNVNEYPLEGTVQRVNGVLLKMVNGQWVQLG
jgi:hypothetical protein